MPGTRPTSARRRQRQAEAIKLRRDALARRAAVKAGRDPDEMAFRRVIDSMSNWQRNQWSGAKYPGLRKRVASLAEPYTMLIRGF